MTTGTAIAIAWPETMCKQAGAWYDPISNFIGLSKNNYYKVGHAALVLVDHVNKEAHYFDFGRYHSPFNHGRVRSAVTDHDLEIKTSVVLNAKKELYNSVEILRELNANASCHGDGTLYASLLSINFEASYQQALELQKQSPIVYGPFIPSGTNCSRFVNTSILKGATNFWHKLLLKFPLTLSPTPMWNVRVGKSKIKLPKEHE